ncbi:MAG: alpha/beta hydrolase, partial [Cyanobacteria bacterium J06636_16]
MMTAIAGNPDHAASPAGNIWTWQGHSVYYVKVGAPRRDRPPLLLIHGFGASTDHW